MILDLLGTLPEGASNPAKFCEATVRAMGCNPCALPGEQAADVYSARFDPGQGRTWRLDVLFKTRNRAGKIRNHRLVMTADPDGDAVAVIDGRRIDLADALYPFRASAPHRSQFPSIFAKHFIKHAR